MQAVLQGVWERGWAERIQSPEPPGPHRCPLFPPINSPSSHTHSLGTQGKVYKTPGKVGKPPRYIYSQHPGNTYHQVPCRGRAGARSSRTFGERLWVSQDHLAQTPKLKAEATAIFTIPGALSLQSWALKAQLPCHRPKEPNHILRTEEAAMGTWLRGHRAAPLPEERTPADSASLLSSSAGCDLSAWLTSSHSGAWSPAAKEEGEEKCDDCHTDAGVQLCHHRLDNLEHDLTLSLNSHLREILLFIG